LKGALTNTDNPPANSAASSSNAGKRRADGKDDATAKKIRGGVELCPWERGLKGCIKAECPSRTSSRRRAGRAFSSELC
jgi:hypothetical protein